MGVETVNEVLRRLIQALLAEGFELYKDGHGHGKHRPRPRVAPAASGDLCARCGVLVEHHPDQVPCRLN